MCPLSLSHSSSGGSPINLTQIYIYIYIYKYIYIYIPYEFSACKSVPIPILSLGAPQSLWNKYKFISKLRHTNLFLSRKRDSTHLELVVGQFPNKSDSKIFILNIWHIQPCSCCNQRDHIKLVVHMICDIWYVCKIWMSHVAGTPSSGVPATYQRDIRREVGGWGRDPFSRNFMKPTPRRKWYLTTGRRFH